MSARRRCRACTRLEIQYFTTDRARQAAFHATLDAEGLRTVRKRYAADGRVIWAEPEVTV